jgi:hypothetical protein
LENELQLKEYCSCIQTFFAEWKKPSSSQRTFSSSHTSTTTPNKKRQRKQHQATMMMKKDEDDEITLLCATCGKKLVYVPEGLQLIRPLEKSPPSNETFLLEDEEEEDNDHQHYNADSNSQNGYKKPSSSSHLRTSLNSLRKTATEESSTKTGIKNEDDIMIKVIKNIQLLTNSGKVSRIQHKAIKTPIPQTPSQKCRGLHC